MAGVLKTYDCAVSGATAVSPSTDLGDFCLSTTRFVLTETKPAVGPGYIGGKVEMYDKDGILQSRTAAVFDDAAKGMSAWSENGMLNVGGFRIFVPNDGAPASGYREQGKNLIAYCQLVLNCKVN